MRGTAAEIAKRNADIVEMRLSRPTLTWVDIAAQFDVSERTAKEAWAQFRKETRDDLVESTENYMDIVAEMISDFQRLRSSAMETFASADNSSAKIGALKLILDLRREEISLLQRTKLLPVDLGIVRIQLDIDYLADRVYDLIQEFVPASKRDAAETTLMEALKPGSRPLAELPPAQSET